VRIREYYSQLVQSERRGGPTFAEAKRDLTSAVQTQIAGYTFGF